KHPTAGEHAVETLLAERNIAPSIPGSQPAPGGRVLVIGAGPAGLATTACLRAAGVNTHLVDRTGEPGGAYAKLYGGITLSSPKRFTQLPGLAIEAEGDYVTIAQYREYLRRYADRFGLLPEQRGVERIKRVGPRFAVTFTGRRQPVVYEAVVAATGMVDSPARPRIEGLSDHGLASDDGPRVLHSRDWPGHAAMAGRRVLIIGGASSAIAIAEECGHAGLPVVVSTRQKRIRFSLSRLLGFDLRELVYPLTRRLPRWLMGSFCDQRPPYPATDMGFRQLCREGVIEVRPGVRRFDGRVAEFSDGSRQEFDVVVLATGYRFAMPFLPEEVARASAGQPLADGGESTSWPGLYFVGIPCGRTLGSAFLHGMAADAPVVAQRIQARLSRLCPGLPGRPKFSRPLALPAA
ncbi:MAG: NAD(P)/FAD-dependent oxidoreductase, partial [Pirellulales bacterium]